MSERQKIKKAKAPQWVVAPSTHYRCDRDAKIECGAPVMVCNPAGGNYPGTVLSKAPQRLKTVAIDVEGRGPARFPREWIIRIMKRETKMMEVRRL